MASQSPPRSSEDIHKNAEESPQENEIKEEKILPSDDGNEQVEEAVKAVEDEGNDLPDSQVSTQGSGATLKTSGGEGADDQAKVEEQPVKDNDE